MIFAEENKNQLLHLADDMAAAATSFKGQGYEVFIQARGKIKRIH